MQVSSSFSTAQRLITSLPHTRAVNNEELTNARPCLRDLHGHYQYFLYAVESHSRPDCGSVWYSEAGWGGDLVRDNGTSLEKSRSRGRDPVVGTQKNHLIFTNSKSVLQRDTIHQYRSLEPLSALKALHTFAYVSSDAEKHTHQSQPQIIKC